MDLPIILRSTSPIPIGHNPGCLSRGINLQVIRESKDEGLCTPVQSFFPKAAIAEHKSLASVPKLDDVVIRLHPSPSSPEGPAPLLVVIA